VHKAVLKSGEHVAVKVQYPGVAKSIDSDLSNLSSLLLFSNMLPPGLFLEKTIAVAKKELGMETDYENEAANQLRFKHLLSHGWCTVS
jgi:aarF domain-containing kinase